MAAITAPHRRSSWQPEIVAMRGPEKLGAGDEQEGDAKMLGFRVQGKSTAVRAEQRVFEEDVIVGVRMRITYEIEPTPTGSRIQHRLEADLPGGPIGGLLSLLLRWRLRQMQRASLEGLARQAGVPPSV